ncbi:MAG: Rrf2 family transcriptional regulator [Bacteroidales bacterium]|nr:Rrf2 family transcriptional regulator [Bacteroidales bacterium]MDT8431185.1 Rrf2 family transcriptional regulator [Bacteroidales bacterium]
MLSNTCKYAIRAVVYISVYASPEKKAGIREISGKLEIPTPFLGKILQSLARNKLLISTKGPHGGFSLGRPAEDISLMDIVEIVDGTDIFDTCLVRTTPCSDESPCGIHDSVTPIRKELKHFFLNQTIADLSTEFRRDSDRISI